MEDNMWSRKELKSKAKEVLRRGYLSAFGVSIVITLAEGGWNSRSNYRSRFSIENPDNINSVFHYFINWKIISMLLIFFLIALVLRILIGYCLEVGGRRYFIKSAQYDDNKRCLRFGFQDGNYKGITTTMLVKNIYIFLWTLLLIIPGIIKSYAYSMVPYILADNPNIGVNRAIELSNEMTRGHKLDMFVLDLSFIGWYILGMIPFGLGVLFVNPYFNATNAELYLVLRKEALNNNLCSYEDLKLVSTDSNDIW